MWVPDGPFPGLLDHFADGDTARLADARPCPETEARLSELDRRFGRPVTAEQLREIHLELTRAARVHDPWT